MMREYVAGFAFDASESCVVLIRKKRPVWQVGRLNAVGGKVEDNELPCVAMVREFREETSVCTNKWWEFVTYSGKEDTGEQYLVHFFCCKLTDIQFMSVKTVTDEDIEIKEVSKILDFSAKNMISNLKWLIPMALNVINKDDSCMRFFIEESKSR